MPAFADDSASEIAAELPVLPAGSAAATVATRLLDHFTTGSWTPGTRLPPERQLAASLGVGRSAVREALASLEILGLVEVRPGSGTYLRGGVSELLPQSLRWGVLLGERSMRELIEVRSGLEIYAARLAAERLTDGQLEDLREALDGMRSGLDDLARFVEADLAYHRLLAASTDNVLLLDLLQTVRSLLRVWVDRAVHDPEEARTALEEHTAVYEALAARDGDAAASAMASHMATAAARLAAEVSAAS